LNVSQAPIEISAAERARWLGELSEALDSARAVMVRLELDPHGSVAAMELYLRIEAARLQVQALRLRRGEPADQQVDPNRTGIMPWEHSCRSIS
jgi:hypothetical protein